MPTGYTAKLMEHGQGFNEFVLTCARAMGALYLMRDDPMDAPIPTFEPSAYHAARIKEAEELLAKLEAMTPDQAMAYGASVQQENLNRWAASEAKEEAENARIDTMTEAVKQWIPPTGEHEGLKEFMLEQLRISRHNTEWSRKYHCEQANTPMGYYRAAIDQAKHDIEYNKNEHARELARCNERNRWVQRLKESLP